jgi:hypothetical protein
MRGMAPASSDRLTYRSYSGFGYTFTPTEIECLATAVGRRAIWEQQTRMHPFHYVTLVVAEAAQAERSAPARSIDNESVVQSS